MIIDKLLKNNPFQMDDKKKDDIFYKQIKLLNNHHYNNCQKYKKIIKSLYAYKPIKNKIKNFPMLPVKIFKKFDLFSVKKNQIVKKLVSSGTSGQELSKIFLDKKNAKNQVKVLKKIMTTVLGEKRLPMLIVDQNPKVLNRSIFNARTAAIYGFSVFGRNYCYLLDDKGNIDYNVLNNFLKMHGKEKFFIFGFTSLIFNNLIKKLLPNRVIGNFTNGILVHGGGWKKLEKVKIDNKIFKKKLFSNIYINFDPSKKKSFKKIIDKFKNKKNIFFTHSTEFNKLILIMNNCSFIIGNESGPICIGAALKKNVLSIYYPKHTNKSSKTIYNKVKFFNTDVLSSRKIIFNILKILK